MSKTGLRAVGAAILLFNLWLIGRYNISGLPVLLMTIGFTALFELVVVRKVGGPSTEGRPPREGPGSQ